MRHPSKTRLKILASCGIISPISAIALGSLASQLRPGYDPVTRFGSELGVGTDSAAISGRTIFVVYGLLTFLFALGLQIGPDKGSRIGPAFVAFFGSGLVVSAAFPCDPGCPLPGQGAGIMQSIHWALFTTGAFSIVLGPLFIAKRLTNEDIWKRYRSYCFGTSSVSTSLLPYSSQD